MIQRHETSFVDDGQKIGVPGISYIQRGSQIQKKGRQFQLPETRLRRLAQNTTKKKPEDIIDCTFHSTSCAFHSTSCAFSFISRGILSRRQRVLGRFGTVVESRQRVGSRAAIACADVVPRHQGLSWTLHQKRTLVGERVMSLHRRVKILVSDEVATGRQKQVAHSSSYAHTARIVWAFIVDNLEGERERPNRLVCRCCRGVSDQGCI